MWDDKTAVVITLPPPWGVLTRYGDNSLECTRKHTPTCVRSVNYIPNSSLGPFFHTTRAFSHRWLPKTARERKVTNSVIVVFEAKDEPIAQAKCNLETENTCTFSSLVVTGGWLGIPSLDF